jgi:hypothetical protein
MIWSIIAVLCMVGAMAIVSLWWFLCAISSMSDLEDYQELEDLDHKDHIGSEL